MKILRVWIDATNTYVYFDDEIEGKAEVDLSAWKAYVEAIHCVNNFELEVDKQYEEKK